MCPFSPHRITPIPHPSPLPIASFQLNEVSWAASSDMSNPPLYACDLVRKWAHVSFIADHNEEAKVDRLAEVLKIFVRAHAQQLAMGANGAPILCSYSNDGTPILVRKR